MQGKGILVRRHLSFVAAVWLIFQVGVLAASPFGLCCSVASQTTVDDDECCKGLAPGQMCPLHKHHHAPTNPAGHHDSAGGAVLRCGCGAVDPALISLSFGLGILTDPVSVHVTLVSNRIALVAARDVFHASAVDPPPPRS